MITIRGTQFSGYILAVWAPKAGRHFTKVTASRSVPEFADYLLDTVAHYPEADTIHLVMDNLSSHTRKAMVERFGEKAASFGVRLPGTGNRPMLPIRGCTAHRTLSADWNQDMFSTIP